MKIDEILTEATLPGVKKSLFGGSKVRPELKQNIKQGVNAWVQRATQLAQAGTLKPDDTESYAQAFVEFVSRMGQVNKANPKIVAIGKKLQTDLTKINQGKSYSTLRSKGALGMQAVQAAMTSFVTANAANEFKTEEPTSKIEFDAYALVQDKIKQNKNDRINPQALMDVIKKYKTATPSIDAYTLASQVLADKTINSTVIAAPGKAEKGSKKAAPPAPGKAPMAPRPANIQSAPTKTQQIPPGTTVPQGDTVWKFNGEKWFDQKGNPADRTEVVSILTKMKDDAAEKANQPAQPAATNNGRANLKGMMSNQNLRKKE